jgi:4-amino-4-deoxy-L-arabinose transferase-like glycosyltransferase
MNNAGRTGDLSQSTLARWLSSAIAAALVGAFLLQALLSMRDMSATFDEPIYIAAGYAYWKTHDSRINPEHPPLGKLLVAIPLLPLGLTIPTGDLSWRARDGDAFLSAFLNREMDHLDQILFRARLPIVFLGALLAVFVGTWAAELWGAKAGLAALLLFVFDPNILAHSRLATLDMPVTVFTFIAMFYVWKWLRTGRPRYQVLASVALGLALLSKASALASLPIFLAVLVLHHVATSRNGSPNRVAPVKGFFQLLVGAAVVVVVVYAVVFRWHPILSGISEHPSEARPSVADQVLARIPGLKGGVPAPILALGQRIWIPDVDSYVQGVWYQRSHLVSGHPSFLMGRHSLYGWWYYYPVAFLIKTPLPILLLVIIRLFLLASVPMGVDEKVVVLPVIGTMILACFDTVDLGIRYLLPLYPFLFVWLSGVLTLWGTEKPATKRAVAH